ncbi:MAG TPA: OmpH family outer membrane protein [Tepidisphaeraceae bacterium]
MMLRTQLSALLLVTLGLIVPAAQAQEAPAKIAVVNTAKVLEDMKETKDLMADMGKENDRLKAEDEVRRKKVQAFQSERDSIKADQPQYATKNEEFLKAAIEYEAWGKITQAAVQRDQKLKLKMLFDRIAVTVTEIAKAKGLDLVIVDQHTDVDERSIDKVSTEQLRALLNQRNVLYVTSRLDISAEVLARLDEKYSTTGK